MGIGKRIKEARERAGLTQEELGKRIGVTGSAITNYEKETSHPKEPIMYALINALGVDANFLFQDCVKTKTAPLYSSEALKLAMDFDGLDTWGKKQVRDVANNERARCETNALAPSMNARPTIPFRQSLQPVSAGRGAYLGPEAFKTIFVEENSLTRRASFGVPVRGDSMEPKYYDGDILIVEGTKDINIGEIGVFTVNGEGYVKKRGDGALISLNPEYDPVDLTEDSCCNGRVIGVLDPAWIVDF